MARERALAAQRRALGVELRAPPPAGRAAAGRAAGRTDLRGRRRPVHRHRHGRPHRGARARPPTSSTSRPARAPSGKQVETGFSPQLTLTAAILAAGGFAEVGRARPASWSMCGSAAGELPGEVSRRRRSERAGLAAEALAGLKRRVARFDDPDHALRSWAAPQFIGRYGGDYDHLARLWEWRVIGAGDGGGRRMTASAATPGRWPPTRRPRPSSPPTPARARPRPWSRGWRGCCCAAREPEAILCVTYTKAAAAEMQRRLFERLGDWAVADDATSDGELAEIGEAGRDLSRARALFARALETPGGLKIQTIHAFCEKLLRRFPLEAGVSPGFAVLDDAAGAELPRAAARRDALALALRPETRPGRGLRPLLRANSTRDASTPCSPTFEARARRPSRAYVEAARRLRDAMSGGAAASTEPADAGGHRGRGGRGACAGATWRRAAEAAARAGDDVQRPGVGGADDRRSGATRPSPTLLGGAFAPRRASREAKLGTGRPGRAVPGLAERRAGRLHAARRALAPRGSPRDSVRGPDPGPRLRRASTRARRPPRAGWISAT